MPIDPVLWRRTIVDQVMLLADEAEQRRAWFRLGPWNTGPADAIRHCCELAGLPAFLAWADNGLNASEAVAVARLAATLATLASLPPDELRPDRMIDDPRWQAMRLDASAALAALTGRSAAVAA